MMDKFLTDLAAHTGCDSVSVSYRGYWSNESGRFHVSLFWNEGEDRELAQGEGPTAEAAMNAAIAKKRAREAEAA